MVKKALRAIRTAVRRHWRNKHAWPGRLVEMTGNRVRVDGLRFSVDNPLISRELKTSLWKGFYEAKERRLLKAHMPPGLPLIELGACIGVISCISNRRLRNPSRHVVVEANEHLVSTLRSNRDINGCNFDIVHAAVGYGAGHVVFYGNEFATSGSLRRPGPQETLVPALSLRAIAERAGFDRFSLICDIEGAEIDLIHNEIDYLRGHAAWVLIEMHESVAGADGVRQLDDVLRSSGFRLVQQLHLAYCYQNENIPAAPEPPVATTALNE